MTAAEKIALLRKMFYQASNFGVLSWGATENGYRWICDNHDTADSLVEMLMFEIELSELDKQGFPYRFDCENKAVLIIEPLDDAN